MAEAIPRWADESISKALSSILEEGESSRYEFKENFPEQAHDLAKEFAAFGTHGGGTLLLGVNDNCEAVGISASNADERDALIRRMRGIVSRVRPDLEAKLGLAIAQNRTVAFVEILEQSEPVFYYDGRPYTRDGTESRPATPSEVKDRIWAHPSSNFKREQERIDQERKQLSLRTEQQQQEAMANISRMNSGLMPRDF